jgi:hypothetical protein
VLTTRPAHFALAMAQSLAVIRKLLTLANVLIAEDRLWEKLPPKTT